MYIEKKKFDSFQTIPASHQDSYCPSSSQRSSELSPALLSIPEVSILAIHGHQIDAHDRAKICDSIIYRLKKELAEIARLSPSESVS